MSEKLEKYANEKVLCATVKNVKSLMENMKISMEQALNVLDIQGGEQSNYIKAVAEIVYVIKIIKMIHKRI